MHWFLGFVAEQFLNNTATQLTYHGLCELTSTVQEGELCVFFRNNHFSTMTKYKVWYRNSYCYSELKELDLEVSYDLLQNKKKISMIFFNHQITR